MDLRGWLADRRAEGLVKDVKGAHWDLEVGGLTDLNVKRHKWTLLFDEIPGYPAGHRILTGTMLDARRVAATFGLPPVSGDLDLVRALRDRLRADPRAAASGGAAPAGRTVRVSSADGLPGVVEVDDAPMMENIYRDADVDVLSLPAPRWHPQDGGRYLGTLDAVITREATSEWVNVGAYRMMVHDPRRLCLFVNASHHARAHAQGWQARGERAPVVVSFGHHPLLSALGGLEIPDGESELDHAANWVGHPWSVLRGPVTGLPVPADSEIAIEGWLSHETVAEGPYGEFVGYYAGGTMQVPVVEIAALYHRRDPILLGTCAGIPPYDYSYYRCPVRAAMLWNALDDAGVPGVAGVWCHEAGYSRAWTVVAIRQAYEGHARQAGMLASQLRESVFGGKYVIVVDDDIDPTDTDQVLWAVSSRTDPARDVGLLDGSFGMALDPSVPRGPGDALNELPMSRAVVNACKPLRRMQRGEWPDPVTVTQAMADKLRRSYPAVLGGPGADAGPPPA